MEVLNFSEFQREIKQIGSKNPKIIFDYYSIKIITLPYFDDILTQLFFWVLCVLFFYNSALFFSVLFFAYSWYLFYINFIGLDICQIDFNTKTIVLKNRTFLLNIVRKIFGIKTEIKFSDIKEFSYKEGSLMNRFRKGAVYDSRYNLLLETHTEPPVSISQFRDEKNADGFVTILKKFVLNKEKILV